MSFRSIRIAAAALGNLVLTSVVSAQFIATPPTQNGVIAASEYGTHTDGQNQQTNGAVIWYLTWDDTYLYVAESGAAITEAAHFYIDTNPTTPVTGTSFADGSTTGNPYDNQTIALPFAADLWFAFGSGINKYKPADGSGGWGTQVSGSASITVATATTVKEAKIPWSILNINHGGARPSAFNWIGFSSYKTSDANNGTYGAMPSYNSTAAPNLASWYWGARRYFTVSSTADGASTKPFNRISYCMTGLNNTAGTALLNSTAWTSTNFGTLVASGVSAYDATINYVGLLNGTVGSITRTNAFSTNSDFTVTHDFLINNGTLDFAASPNNCAVGGNLTVASGGTLKLSTQAGGQGGGGLSVGGNFSNSGSFVPNNASVVLNGPSPQTLASGSYKSLAVVSPGGVTLAGNATVTGDLAITGTLSLGGNTLSHQGSSATTSTGWIVTSGGGIVKRPSGASLPYTFRVGPDSSSYDPVTLADLGGTVADDFSVNVVNGISAGTEVDNTKDVSRTWTVSEGTAGGSNLSLAFQWNAADAGGAITPANAVAWHWNGSTWQNQGGSTTGGGPYTTTVSGVTSLSPWAVGEPSSLPVQFSRLSLD